MSSKHCYLFVFILSSQCVLGEWRWKDKVAVVTGASSGIGAEVAIQLANKGMIVAALARREHRLQEVAEKTTGKIYPIICDVTNEKDIIKAFKWVEANLGGVDVLINNAGVFIPTPLIDFNTKDANTILDLNLLGAAICSREALKTMRQRGDDGQIININSMTGHTVVHTKNFFVGIYTASKYGLTAMSEALSNELADAGSKIKVTSLSPGLVHTEIDTNLTSSFQSTIQTMPRIDVDDIAESVIYILSTRPNVHIAELKIKQIGLLVEC